MMTPHRALAASLALSLLAWPAWAQGGVGGDPIAGRRVAQSWCANCHQVEANAAVQSTDAPPAFAAIAQRPDFNADALRGFVQGGHRQMPDFHLDRAQVADVVDYIASLKR